MINPPSLPLFLTALILVSFTGAVTADCSASRVINLDIPASNLKEFRLQALAGHLEVVAGGADQIKVVGKACAPRQEMLAEMQIRSELIGNDVLEVTTYIPVSKRGWGNASAYIDLEVEIPAMLMTHIKDSSGHANVSGITLASVNDSSGDLRIRQTRGPMHLRDSSGNLHLREHNGNLELQDSSGNLQLREITGDVTIHRDSSGEIEIVDVSGTVLIEQDSSGDIEVDRVGKDVVILADGSGNISISDVEGSVEIGRDGSGDVRIKSVAGNLTIEAKGNGRVRTADVKGQISIPRGLHRS